jgi:flagellar M-ring protein FliF
VNYSSVAAQFGRIWSSLSRLQRISIGAAILAIAGGMVWFTAWHREQDFRPAFTGMAGEDAGTVVAKLRESGVEYRLSEDGKSVLVPSAKVADVRLQMAAAGLPRTGRIGFELFDKANLGATDFAEQVNYRRALEGELERTIRSIGEVEQARVHLSFAKDSVFTEAREPAKASVLLTVRSGSQITPGNIKAIVNLVASGVEGLAPESVSVTDSSGRLLNRAKKTNGGEDLSEELLGYRRMLERDLIDKVNTTLEPLLGAGKFRVGVSVDCDYSSGEQSEEIYDPEKSVMVTSQKTEEATGANSSGGVPGTASNLPRPAPRSASATGGVIRRTENVTFQTSHTVRRTRLPQGNVRRISTSVLLDQAVKWEFQNGRQTRVLVPPTAESIQSIKEVVSAIVGLVPSRGDQLVIQTLPFETTLGTPPPPVPVPQGAPAKPAPSPANFGLPMDWRIAAGGAAVVLLSLLAGAWLWFRKRQTRKKTATVQVQPGLPAGSQASTAAVGPGPADGKALEPEKAAKLLAQAQDRVVQTARIESLVEDLRNGIESDPALAASVLRTWLEEGQPAK